MKVKNILILMLIVVIFSASNMVNADTVCSNEEFERLKEKALNVIFNYDYEIKEVVNGDSKYEYADFYLIAKRLDSEIKVMVVDDYYNDKYRVIEDGDKMAAAINGFKSGEFVKIIIEARGNSPCAGRILLEREDNMPYFNSKYYYSDECSKWGDFKYCQRVIDEEIDDETFYQELEKHYANVLANHLQQNEDISGSFYTITLVVMVTLAIVIVCVFIIIKKRRIVHCEKK